MRGWGNKGRRGEAGRWEGRLCFSSQGRTHSLPLLWIELTDNLQYPDYPRDSDASTCNYVACESQVERLRSDPTGQDPFLSSAFESLSCVTVSVNLDIRSYIVGPPACDTTAP